MKHLSRPRESPPLLCPWRTDLEGQRGARGALSPDWLSPGGIPWRHFRLGSNHSWVYLCYPGGRQTPARNSVCNEFTLYLHSCRVHVKLNNIGERFFRVPKVDGPNCKNQECGH